MNTAIGHLENIMEQQQQQQNTNKAQQKHYHTPMIYPWRRNGVALDVVVVERLQFSSKTQKKRMNTYEKTTSFGSENGGRRSKSRTQKLRNVQNVYQERLRQRSNEQQK
jgi:hypothetical protein